MRSGHLRRIRRMRSPCRTACRAGFDELSVAPPSVPAVKERIRGLETPQAELTARRAVEAATASEVHELIGVG